MLKHYDREKIIWDSHLSSHEKFLLLALNSFVDAKGECWPGQELLARMTGFSDRTIRNLCKTLEEKAIVERWHRQVVNTGHRSSDLYRVNFQSIIEFQPENHSGQPERSSARKTKKRLKLNTGKEQSQPETVSARTSQPEKHDKPTGKTRQSQPETVSGDLSNKNYPVELSSNTPLTPQGEFSSGGMAVKNNAGGWEGKKPRKKKDILEAAPPALVEWAEQVTSDLFDDWRKFVFQPARPTSACSRRDFTRSLLQAVLEDEYEPKRIEQGFRLWIEAGQTALKTGKELFGVPDSSRAARRNRTTGDEPKWVGYLEAWEDQSSSLSSENLKSEIAQQLKRLNRHGYLPSNWQQKTGKLMVSELSASEAQAYLLELQSLEVSA